MTGETSPESDATDGPDADRGALLRLFFEEAQEGLAAMEQALLAMEASPSDREALKTVFRVAHTLKGNAQSLGFDELVEVTHHLEDVLDRMRSGHIPPTRDVVDLLLASVDVLRGMLEEAKG
jgi:two-component system, chemotaxis family, sensor kinase CheA